MTRSIIVSTLLAATGCFSADTLGAVCTEDAQCGPGFRCERPQGIASGKCGEQPSCPDFPLVATSPVVDSTTDFADKAACTDCNAEEGAGQGARDVAYSFTAQTEGTHLFRTLGPDVLAEHAGSEFPTVLYLFEGDDCSGTEAVSDVHGFSEAGDNESLVAAYLSEGQVATVVVDGENSESPGGRFALATETLSGQCPDVVANGATIEGDASNRGNTRLSSCASPLSEDYTVGFTAEVDGLYIFEVGGASVPALLSVTQGQSCDDKDVVELACGADALSMSLTAGQDVLVAVEGADRTGPGAFDLAVERCATDITDAVAEAPDDGAPVSGTTAVVGLGPAMSPSCRAPDAPVEAAVAAHTFTARVGGVHRFDPSDSSVATRLAIRGGDSCIDDEVACVSVVDTSEDAIELNLALGEQVVIVVETIGGPADYALRVELPEES